jgi:RNA polymerase sigma-70 factor (ECF subfamily)
MLLMTMEHHNQVATDTSNVSALLQAKKTGQSASLLELLDKSDAELVLCLKAGQNKALYILYKRYAGLVYSIAYKILTNPQEAEDLTQEIFFTFWKQDHFDLNQGTLSSFLGLLTRSRAIDKLRSRKAAQNFLVRSQQLIVEERSDLLPLEQVSLEERQEKLRQALGELLELQRRVLEMNYFEGLSHAKIAKALN